MRYLEKRSADGAMSVPKMPKILPGIRIGPKKERKHYATMKLYKSIVKTFAVAGIPFFDKLDGLHDVIEAWTSSGTEESLWDQIKDKVLSSQRSGITDYHIQ